MLGRFVRPQSGRFLPRGAAFLASCASFFIFAQTAFAQSGFDTGLNYATAIGLATGDIRTTIALIINAFFGLLGILAVILMLYAGYLWMMARGDAEQVEEAKDVMRNAVIGLIIIFSAYAIAFFVFRALTGQDLVGGVTVDDQTQNVTLQIAPPGSGALGNGILSTHYPTRDQNNVARNTMIVLTFKQPLVLSSVIQGYNDKNTYATGDDDVYSGNFRLNTTNIKIIPQSGLAGGGNGTSDEQFGAIYGAAIANATVRLTPVPTTQATFNPNLYQSLSITFATPLGSAVSPMNYRVALRGGPNGVRVWGTALVDSANQTKDPRCVTLMASAPAGQVEKPQCAFPIVNPNTQGAGATGGYYWAFTTSTTLDLTPPKIIGVVPVTIANPASGDQILSRNQLLQLYFDEAVDPTTASGVVGAGFLNVNVQTKPISGGSFVSLAGTVTMGSQYRVAQFTPSTLCDGRSQNACGEPVYCMPPNVDLQVTVVPATLGSNPPQSAGQFDGITDMANNSLDGNGNGSAQGPGTNFYNWNAPQSDLSSIVDTVRVTYRVGTDIDLVPPTVVNIDPRSYAENGDPTPSTLYTNPTTPGPSQVPPITPVTVTWSKPLDVNSLRTGPFTTPNNNATVTIGLLAKEFRNSGVSPCPAEGCTKTAVTEAPSFEVGLLLPVAGQQQMVITHRPFFLSNQLGWVKGDEDIDSAIIPQYVPKITAQVRDTAQNCFYPSMGYQCSITSPPTLDSVTGKLKTSCCNRKAESVFPDSSTGCNP